MIHERAPQTRLQNTKTVLDQFEKSLGEYQPGELLVKMKPMVELHNEETFFDSYQATVIENIEAPGEALLSSSGPVVHIALPPTLSVAEAILAMSEDSRVEYAEPNTIYELDEEIEVTSARNTSEKLAGATAPNDLTDDLWGLRNNGKAGKRGADINATRAWKTTTGSRENGPLIAVIDSGTDYTHPDLKANMGFRAQWNVKPV